VSSEFKNEFHLWPTKNGNAPCVIVLRFERQAIADRIAVNDVESNDILMRYRELNHCATCIARQLLSGLSYGCSVTRRSIDEYGAPSVAAIIATMKVVCVCPSTVRHNSAFVKIEDAGADFFCYR